jgi:hypothetical protein
LQKYLTHGYYKRLYRICIEREIQEKVAVSYKEKFCSMFPKNIQQLHGAQFFLRS